MRLFFPALIRFFFAFTAGSLVLALGPVATLAQTPSKELENLWDDICAGALQSSLLVDRCREIFPVGGLFAGRAAALGNNLEVTGSLGRVAREKEVRFINWDLGSFNLIFTANNGRMNRSRSEFEHGFDSILQGALLGIDYLRSRRYVVGLAMNYATTDADFEGSRGDLETQMLGLTSYGGYSLTDEG